jgi:hypothetical protein
LPDTSITLAGRVAVPLRPYPCEVASSVGVLREWTGSMAKGELDRKAAGDYGCQDCGCADTQILESANDTNDLYDISRSNICFITTVSHIDCATPSVRSPLKQQHCSNTFSPLRPFILLLSARLRPSAPFCSLAPMNPPLPLANSPPPLPLPLCLAQGSCAYDRVFPYP